MMSVDELKSLVEIVKTVSGDARTVLLWYLGVNLLDSLLWWAFWIITIERLLRPLHRLISHGHMSAKVAQHLGIDADIDRSDSSNCMIHRWIESAIDRERAARHHGTAERDQATHSGGQGKD